jgi:hypothetical protein
MQKPKRKITSASIAAPAKSEWRPAADSIARKANSQSKQSRIITLLQASKGATFAAMMKVTGWQQHSVRGFLAGVVRKRLKLKLDSKKVDGNRVYRIAGGGGKAEPNQYNKPRSH